MRANRSAEVDAYLARAEGPVRALAQALRDALHGAAALDERIRYGCAFFQQDGRDVAYLSTARRHVTLGFPEGARLQDEGALLSGTGRSDVRRLVLRPGEPLPLEEIVALVAEAAAGRDRLRLRLPAVERERMVAHARRESPREACGVLVGEREAAALVVRRAVPTRNDAAMPEARYRVAPEDLARAVVEAERDGLDVVGFYHSHPRGPARLSSIDEAEASWHDAAYLLVWLAPSVGCAAWQWNERTRAFGAMDLDVSTS